MSTEADRDETSKPKGRALPWLLVVLLLGLLGLAYYLYWPKVSAADALAPASNSFCMRSSSCLRPMSMAP